MINPKNLKKSILDYAVRGELSAKFRTEFTNLSAYDEIAEFNAKISTLKSQREKLLSNLEKLLKTKPKNSDKIKHIIAKLKTKIKSYRTITPLNTAPNFNPPFEIPNSWAWVKLGEICEISSGGTPSRSNASFWVNGTIPWIKISDIKGDYINSATEFITQKGLENSSAKIFRKGTLLYTIFATLGEVGILNFEATTNQAIAGISLNLDVADRKFMLYNLRNLKEYVFSIGRGMAQMNINQNILKEILIPLPPKNEQEFIASELEKLLSLCKNL